MGSGSSRAGAAPRQPRGADGRPAPPGDAPRDSCAEPRGAATVTAEAQAPGATEREAGPAPRPAAPPDGREETLRLLDQLLAESAAWGSPEPAPRAPARPRPSAGAVSPEQKAEGQAEGGCASEAPGSSHKKPEGQPPISYDYSEEELMASIEREYGR